MFKSFTRSIKCINKDQFDTSILKATMDDDLQAPKEKHVKIIIRCLRGEDEKMSVAEGYGRMADYLLKTTSQKNIKTLKLAYILHQSIIFLIYFFKLRCNSFIEAVSQTEILRKVKPPTSDSSTTDAKAFILSSIASGYMLYLEYYFRMHSQIQDTSNVVNSLSKIVQLITLMTKMQKELDLGLQKIENNRLVREIANLIISDLKLYYSKLYLFIKPQVQKLLTYDRQQGSPIYALYQDLLRMSRGVRLLLLLDFSQDKLKIFQVDSTTNRQIELYYLNKKQSVESAVVSRRMSVNELNQQKRSNSKHEILNPQPSKTSIKQLEIIQLNKINYYNTDINEIKQQKNEKEKEEQEPPLIFFDEPQLQKDPKQKEPEPDEIKIVPSYREKSQQPIRRVQFERKRTNTKDSQRMTNNFFKQDSYYSQTTQQSFLNNNHLMEMRILGINSISSNQKPQNHIKGGFFNHRFSPLDFIQIQNGDKSPQAYQ